MPITAGYCSVFTSVDAWTEKYWYTASNSKIALVFACTHTNGSDKDRIACKVADNSLWNRRHKKIMMTD